MSKTSKICPNCGHKMHQQFIGLQHCNCGLSWQKGVGFFERTKDMVFCLRRVHVGKKGKTKQVPTIRFYEDSQTPTKHASDMRE